MILIWDVMLFLYQILKATSFARATSVLGVLGACLHCSRPKCQRGLVLPVACDICKYFVHHPANYHLKKLFSKYSVQNQLGCWKKNPLILSCYFDLFFWQGETGFAKASSFRVWITYAWTVYCVQIGYLMLIQMIGWSLFSSNKKEV